MNYVSRSLLQFTRGGIFIICRITAVEISDKMLC